MPRPKKPGQDGKEVKKRSRNGCWPCKARKVKCGEEKPACSNCQRQGEACDYSIRLNWDGRSKKKDDARPGSQLISFDSPPSTFGRHDSAGSSTSPSYHGMPSLDSMASHTASAYDSRPTSPFSMPPAHEAPPPLASIASQPSPATAFDPALPPLPSLPRNTSWQDSSGMGTFPESGISSPGMIPGMFNSNGHSMQMPPPLPTPIPMPSVESARSPHNNAKRMRLSPRFEHFSKSPHLVHRASSYGAGELEDMQRPPINPPTPTFWPSQVHHPLTPGASSTTSDDRWLTRINSHLPQEAEDRRISVSSLLSGSSDPEDAGPKLHINPPLDEPVLEGPLYQPRRGSLHQSVFSYSEMETYGLDRGYPDLDIPKNNDTVAITGVSPSEHSDFDSWLSKAAPGSEFGFRLEKREQVFASGGYYASPVTIKIPRSLGPLPQTLQQNPMNMLYFHHFLNHTARILVPHDCPENPFKTILPQMAVENPNLLNLLLAYSASHRARLLSHPEPVHRIALWVQDVFPSLRHSLENISNSEVSNSNLATAIMLASLEIISPSSFGVSIPWQDHLGVARSIIRSKGGPGSISRDDPVLYFLTRWLAYLDILGSLSGRRNEEPLFGGKYWSSSNPSKSRELSLLDDDADCDPDIDDDDCYTIDCLLGFTTRCVSILAQIASLARQCDWQRLDAETGQVRPDWQPPADVLEQAERLRRDIKLAREHTPKHCLHHSPQLSKANLYCGFNSVSDEASIDAHESVLVNSAFHWAGLVHLLRRVYNLPRSDPEVHDAVHELVKVLSDVREGGSAEACLLFPLFTAGVEADLQEDRDAVLARVENMENIGMCQVGLARRIMEDVWTTGKSWEGMVNGEFFG